MSEIDHDDDYFFLFDEVKEPIVSYSIPVISFELPFEFFDIGTEIGIGAQLGIDDIDNLVINFLVDRFSELSETFCLGDLEVIQRYILRSWPLPSPVSDFRPTIPRLESHSFLRH